MSVALIADKLRASLLQAAIQGKLTKQLVEDGDARDLLKEIETEKARLIEDKIIKKEKPLPPITEDEIPFEIPENWAWVRFNDIVHFNLGKTPPRADAKYWGKGFPWVSISDLIDGEMITATKEEISHKGKDKAFSNIMISPKGTLLMSFKLTIGKVSILGMDAYHNEAIISIYPFKDNSLHVVRNFLMLFLPSISLSGNFNNAIKGNTLNKKSLSELIIPLPPLAEQCRIVEAIETALAKIDELKSDETNLYNIQKAFPNKLRASLLQSAIQGQLTEQLPEDGNARDLLEEIEAEKARLIEEKIIKKEKPLPPITGDEIPFEIPENWVWVYLKSLILETDAGKSPKCEGRNVSLDQWGVLTTTAIQKNLFLEEENKILPSSFVVNEAMQVKNQDLLITRAGPTNRTGVACVVNNLKYKLILSDKTVRIKYMLDMVNPNYLALFINSDFGIEQVKELATGMDKQQVNLSQDKIKSFKIPLPPLAEQERIVKKLDEILGKVDRLKKIAG